MREGVWEGAEGDTGGRGNRHRATGGQQHVIVYKQLEESYRREKGSKEDTGRELQEEGGQQAMRRGWGSYRRAGQWAESYKRAAVIDWCKDSCTGLLVLYKYKFLKSKETISYLQNGCVHTILLQHV